MPSEDKSCSAGNIQVKKGLLAEETLESFISGITETAMLVDMDGNILLCNSTAGERFGAKCSEMINKNFFDYLDPDVAAARRNKFGEVLDNQKGLVFQDIRSGRIIENSYYPVCDSMGKIRAVAILGFDITEKRNAELEAEVSGRKFRSLFENMMNGYAHCKGVFDNNGNLTDFIYLDVNESFEKITHLKDVIGKKVTEVIPEIRETNPELFEIYGKCASTGIADSFETHVKPLDEWLNISVYCPDVGSFIAVFENITEKKKGGMELEKTLNELMRSNEELEQFAYIASHDLQEPLRMVSSYAGLVMNRYKEKFDPETQGFMGYMIDGAKRMQELISALLTYSRINERHNELVKVSINKTIDQVKNNISILIEETHAEIIAEDMPDVLYDGIQLVQLFQNLFCNAIKFRGCETPKIEVSAVEGNYEWIFGVKDNGIGIEPRHFDRIFQIFQRLHSREEYDGTGIGLAVCKKIAERFGGRIWVESVPGAGSTFFFTIPFSPLRPHIFNKDHDRRGVQRTG